MKEPKIPGTEIQLLSHPSKLDVPGWALPAIRTCPKGPCNLYCYGTRKRFAFKTVKRAQLARLEWTKKCEIYETGFPWSQEQWLRVMHNAIEPYRRFRWSVTGDIYSIEYAKMCITLFKSLPETKFWIPTRQFKNKNILPYLREMNKIAVVRPSADPGQEPYKIDGLSAGTTIANPNIFQCPANTNPSHGCEGCVVCYENREQEVSYKLK